MCEERVKMGLCKICFEETQKGVAVPGYGEASGMVHEECLAAVALEIDEGRHIKLVQNIISELNLPIQQ